MNLLIYSFTNSKSLIVFHSLQNFCLIAFFDFQVNSDSKSYFQQAINICLFICYKLYINLQILYLFLFKSQIKKLSRLMFHRIWPYCLYSPHNLLSLMIFCDYSRVYVWCSKMQERVYHFIIADTLKVSIYYSSIQVGFVN